MGISGSVSSMKNQYSRAFGPYDCYCVELPECYTISSSQSDSPGHSGKHPVNRKFENLVFEQVI